MLVIRKDFVMNRKNFWLDVALCVLLALTVVSLFMEGQLGRVLHYGAGTLMIAGSVWHLLWHWSWIKANVLRYPREVNGSARANRRINIGLFAFFTLSGVSGLVIWLMEIADLSRFIVPFSVWYRGHELTGLLMFLVMVLHLAYHWKWLAAMTRRMLVADTGKPKLSDQTS
jgi:hypothetical protein